MRKLLGTCLIFLLLIAMHGVRADNHIVITDKFSTSERIAPHLHRWLGDYQPLDSLHEQMHLFSYWQQGQKNNSFSLLKGKPVQMMFTIENRSASALHLALVHPHSTLQRITLQYWQDGKKITQYETGNELPFHSRPVSHRDFVFPIDIAAQQSLTVLMEIDGQQNAFIRDFRLWPMDDFLARTDIALIGYAMLFGILLLLTLYHALIYLLVRELSYLWFALFVAALLLRSLTMNNITFEFFWPNSPALQNFVVVSSVMASGLLTALFAISYLGINRRTPKLLLTYKVYIGLHLVAMTIQAWYGWPAISVSYWLLVAAPFSLFILISSFWLFRHGNKNAGIFLLSYCVLIGSGFISAGNQFFNLNTSFNPPEEIGQLVQILILSLMLSWNIGESREKAHFAYARNKAKNDFLAKMSHEIRTPINGVLGMAQLLSETPLSRKQQHYADVINHCSKTLLNVINNILEYSKIEAGKLELENTAFNLDDLLLNNNGLFWPQIHNKGLSYQFYFDPRTPLNVLGDPTRLQQIFNNVFSNAIKFTDHGSIRLEVNTRKMTSDTVTIEFAISDTGIGIREDDIEHIFAPFSQANASTSRLYGGSGLGLNITQQIIKLMGGKLELHSQPKIGTTFRFEIPFALDIASELVLKKPSMLFRKKSALVVSREDTREDMVNNVMAYWNIECRNCIDIDEAFELITEGEEETFDIYCIEQSLFNHFSPAQKHALHPYGQQILVYDCTFNGSSSDLYLEGFHWLHAPFSIRQLFLQLADIFGMPTVSGARQAPEELAARSNAALDIRVLVAEDDATNRLVIRAILKKLDIEHDIVGNGLMALERYQQNPRAYNILLMDCEMPEMNGYQASRAIRDYEKAHGLKAVPVIALTAHVLPEYEQRCYENGMNLVIAKPVNIEELSSAFRRFAPANPADAA